jgi:hypothetical protein
MTVGVIGCVSSDARGGHGGNSGDSQYVALDLITDN